MHFKYLSALFTATRDESLCVIANPAFVVYSSIVSFYVPFIIILLVYVQIYVVLRKRRKRVNTKPKQRLSQAADPDVPTSLKVSSCPTSDGEKVPLLSGSDQGSPEHPHCRENVL